jgi:hypothetical protein
MDDKIMYDGSGYGVLLEQIIHQNDILTENMGEMRDLARRIPFIEAKVVEHDAKFEIVIKAIHDLSKVTKNHEVRITRLEQTA